MILLSFLELHLCSDVLGLIEADILDNLSSILIFEVFSIPNVVLIAELVTIVPKLESLLIALLEDIDLRNINLSLDL